MQNQNALAMIVVHSFMHAQEHAHHISALHKAVTWLNKNTVILTEQLVGCQRRFSIQSIYNIQFYFVCE